MGVHSHGRTVQATPGMGEGMDEWMKVQAVAWACAAMDEGLGILGGKGTLWTKAQACARVHETLPRGQARCR